MAARPFLFSMKFSPFSQCSRQQKLSNVILRNLSCIHGGSALVGNRCHALDSPKYKVPSLLSLCGASKLTSPAKWSTAGCVLNSNSHNNTSALHGINVRSLSTSATHFVISGRHEEPNPPPPPSSSDPPPPYPPASSMPTDLHRQQVENSSWLVRLSADNNYLSTCRNVYIASVVGVTVHLQHVVPYANDISFLFFFMGGLNLMVGTWAYLMTLRRIRRRHGTAWLGLVFHAAMALVHVTLWLSAVIIYLGYMPEDDVVEECACIDIEGEEGASKGQARVRRIIVDVKPADDNDNGGRGRP